MSEIFRADLHTHSYFSDGTCSPEELIDLAKEKGLQGLSITDHDTQEAYPRAFLYAKERNFPLLPGIEFSTSHRKESVHILCYAHNPKSVAIQKLCAQHKERRRERNSLIIARLQKLGIPITEEEVAGRVKSFGTMGRPHIGQLLVQKGVVSDLKEAFSRYLGEGKAAYVEGVIISLEETVASIHEARGKAVIAHPMLIQRSNVLKTLLEMPFDGIEGYYAEISAEIEAPYIEKARKKGWLITGGSDFHGLNKAHNPLGSSWVDHKTFTFLYEHYLSQPA